MTRYHTTPEGDVPFTDEEEAEADAMEAAFVASLVPRAKENKTAEVVRKFDSVKNAPVAFLGETFHGGIDSAQMAKSKADMVIRQGEAAAGVAPFATTFNDVNDSPINFDTDQLQDLAVVIGQAFEAAFQNKARLKRSIAALAVLEDVKNFDVEAEWAQVPRPPSGE